MAGVGLVGDAPLLPPQHAAQDPEFLQIPAVASDGADHLQQDRLTRGGTSMGWLSRE